MKKHKGAEFTSCSSLFYFSLHFKPENPGPEKPKLIENKKVGYIFLRWSNYKF